MDPKIKAQEETHLIKVVTKVKNAKYEYSEKLSIIGKDNLEKLRDIRESGETGADFEMLLYQLGEKNGFNLKERFNRLQEMEYLSEQPYFARIDLSNKESEKEQHIYIGKFGYTEENPIITDWRAKVASVYYRYRYPQKNVSYDTPNGKEVKDLILKRSFEIEKGKLFKYYNNDLQLDENGIIIEKISKRTGGVLEDIIETIQLSQINIIEADPRQVCIVQGCVGSGKSTVAIHKLAHIFFNYPKLIHPERSILVAKNQILTGYLSTLFPKLGIFDINYKTLRELIFNLVFREELGIKVDFSSEERIKEFGIKKITDLKKQIEKLHTHTENKINDIFTKSEFISFKSMRYSSISTPCENISDILSDLEEELDSEREFLKENPNAERSFLYKENVKALRKLIEKFTAIRAELKNKTLRKMAGYFGIGHEGKMTYLETIIYAILYSEIVGIQKFSKFEYCVVDEGQDFSLLEYTMLSKLVMRGRFAIFGDLNQSMEETGIDNWESIGKVINEAKKAELFELDTNYRSTKQIVDKAKNILNPYAKKFLPRSINRNGIEPEIKILKNSEEITTMFKKLISVDLKNITKSIGIICFDNDVMNELNSLINKISSHKVIELSSDQKITYDPKGVYLMNVDNCKGLEFSKVYVVGLNLNQIVNLQMARRAFVAITRAMNELIVLGTK